MPTVSIYTNLISQISAILSGITNIKEVIAYPASKLTKYPTAIFFPSSFENSFETTRENSKVYKFKLYIVIGATQSTVNNIFSTVLPNTVDSVMEAFDFGWSGSSINGHRTSIKIDSGDWTLSEENKGLEAVAELNITIKLLTTN